MDKKSNVIICRCGKICYSEEDYEDHITSDDSSCVLVRIWKNIMKIVPSRRLKIIEIELKRRRLELARKEIEKQVDEMVVRLKKLAAESDYELSPVGVVTQNLDKAVICECGEICYTSLDILTHAYIDHCTYAEERETKRCKEKIAWCDEQKKIIYNRMRSSEIKKAKFIKHVEDSNSN